MKVVNIHKRTIHQPKQKVGALLDTISSQKDMIWPHNKWPRLKLNDGFNIGSKGGHGPIRYFVKQYTPGERIEFEFTYPKGFKGSHWVEIKDLEKNKSEIKHTINMEASGKDILTWACIVGPLHDALIEDAFDKVENQLDGQDKKSDWSLWVKFCRKCLNPGRI